MSIRVYLEKNNLQIYTVIEGINRVFDLPLISKFLRYKCMCTGCVYNNSTIKLTGDVQKCAEDFLLNEGIF